MDFSLLNQEELQTEGKDFRPEPPPIVAGRHLHIDADFLAYQCGYRWEEESLQTATENLKVAALTLRIMAGAEHAVLHTTMGDKAGRYQVARVKEYQALRKERPQGLTDRANDLRNFMANWKEPGVVPSTWTDREADDGICNAMWEANERGHQDYHVMWSRDKDLSMVGGLHMDPDTYEIESFPWGYGSCRIDESTSSKKVKGAGTSFFWHQMLMGDSADNIPGLPALTPQLQRERMPTKTYLKARERLNKAKGAAKIKAAKIALKKLEDNMKPKTIGPVMAHSLLKDCSSDKEAFQVIRECYKDYYGARAQVASWDGWLERRWLGDLILEQARLLWMQRYKGDDVAEWIREIHRA